MQNQTDVTAQAAIPDQPGSTQDHSVTQMEQTIAGMIAANKRNKPT